MFILQGQLKEYLIIKFFLLLNNILLTEKNSQNVTINLLIIYIQNTNKCVYMYMYVYIIYYLLKIL